MIRRGSPRTLLCCAFALAASTGCASRQTLVVHSEPRVVAESEERLAVEVQELEDGSISLKVFRERDRVLEQRFWKMQAEKPSGNGTTASVGVAPAPAGSPAGDAIGQLAAVGLVAVGAIVVGIGYGLYLAFDALFTGIKSIFPHAPKAEVRPADDAVVVRRQDLGRKLSSTVSLVRADTGQRMDLGIQPTDGYRIGPEQLDLLGARGVVVVVRDENLSIETTLGSPR